MSIKEGIFLSKAQMATEETHTGSFVCLALMQLTTLVAQAACLLKVFECGCHMIIVRAMHDGTAQTDAPCC